MARIRSIHPELCTDETLPFVSAEAERTFVRLMPHLDDAGRAVDNPRLLKAAMYPLHDDVTAADVDGWLWELARHGLVIRYQKDGKRYISAKPAPWEKWQKPRWKYESKLPSPDGAEVVEVPGTSDVRRNTSDCRRSGVGVGVGVGVGEGVGVPSLVLLKTSSSKAIATRPDGCEEDVDNSKGEGVA